MFKRLWQDESGVVVTAELVLVMTVLTIGVAVGISELQKSVVDELNDVGEAIGSVNQTYYIGGVGRWVDHQNSIRVQWRAVARAGAHTSVL